MPRIKPVSRQDLIHRLKELEFQGPYSGGKHEFMLRGEHRIILPNPHRSEISVDLLTRFLRQAGVTRSEWEKLG